MKPDRPSDTARRVAFVRAAHQVLDTPRVLDDPVALSILGPGAEARIRAARGRLDSPAAEALRGFLVARSRIAEDAVEAAFANGVRQYVVLGAGLDTFAYRHPLRERGLRIFEVDFPSTQRWKRTLLERTRVAIPPSLTYVPVDFESQSLADRLRESGFRADAPAWVSWLGVTMYLHRATVLATLRFVAGLPAGSGVTFDYFAPPGSMPVAGRLWFMIASLRVAIGGEPWRTWFDPAALAAELRAMGFTTIEDLDAGALNQRVFGGRMKRLGGRGVGRVLSATR